MSLQQHFVGPKGHHLPPWAQTILDLACTSGLLRLLPFAGDGAGVHTACCVAGQAAMPKHRFSLQRELIFASAGYGPSSVEGCSNLRGGMSSLAWVRTKG